MAQSIFTSVLSHIQPSLSSAVRTVGDAVKNRRQLEPYSCHTVKKKGHFSCPLYRNNHQFSSVVAGCRPAGPAVFATIYLLY